MAAPIGSSRRSGRAVRSTTLYDRIGGYRPDPMSAVFVAAMREVAPIGGAALGGEDAPPDTLGEQIERVMQLTARPDWTASSVT